MPPESYFTDDSMVRRVHREFVVGLAGPRTLLLQATHPVAFAGFFAHTGALDEPYERLARTAQVMDAITFGPRAAADRLTRRVRAMHRRVRGELAEPAGHFPAGTPYAADDPELLLWILAAIVDSSLLVYGKYVRGLSRRRARRLLAGLQAHRPPVRAHRRPDAGHDRGLRRLHARDARERRPLHHAAGPRAGDRDRHAPAGAAEGPPAARARQPDHRRAAARARSAAATASRGTRRAPSRCTAGRSTSSASSSRCCRSGCA